MSELRECILADLRRVSKNTSVTSFLKFLIFNFSFKQVFWFRIGSYLKNSKFLFSNLAYRLVHFLYKSIQFKTGIQLPLGTCIEKGLSFSHYSCIVINNGSKIGESCTIFQGVTIGSKRGENGGSPIIGDNVVLCANSTVVGPVRIGNNCIIGAGSVVTKDVMDNAVVAGVPAKIISMEGARHVAEYKLN